MAAFLMAVVFLTPNADSTGHESFFAAASQCTWGRFWDWTAAWCSVKIILLSVAAMMILEAITDLCIRHQNYIAELTLLTLAFFPMLLFLFGTCELIKALL